MKKLSKAAKTARVVKPTVAKASRAKTVRTATGRIASKPSAAQKSK